MKRGKKRRNNHSTASVQCHIQTEAAVDDSIESCLADLEAETNPLYAQAHNNTGQADSNDDDLQDAALASGSAFPFEDSSLKDRNDRLRTWDSAFQTWNSSGQYTSGLLPCFESELHRHFQLKNLSGFLLESCKDLKMPAFERWLLDSKLEERQKSKHKPRKRIKAENQYNDPVLPKNPFLDSPSSQRLIEEIRETGSVEKGKALKIAKDLFRRTQSAIQEIHSQQIRCASQTPFKKDKIEVEHGSYLVSLLYSKKKWKSPFIVKINISHYDKLKQRFRDTHKTVVSSSDFDNTKKRNKAQHALHLLMMVIALRYSSLSGGQLLDDFRGGGMQGAINEQGFVVLKDYFPQSNLFECFGSPLNATLPCFSSAFESVDWHFGSAGDLATCPDFKDGCCGEANPPFTPGFMEMLADWISLRLSMANQDNKSLSFVVIVPSVHDKELSKESMRVASAVKRFAARAHRQMTESKECTLHIVLPAKEHGYVEGAQHLRPTRYKRSLYDTSVILLQSQQAQSANLDKESFESSIRKAFAERHSEESKKRAKSTDD